MINKEVNVHGELQKQKHRQQLEPNRNPAELRPTEETLLRAVHSVCAALACVAGSPCRLVMDLATLKQLNQKTKPKAKGHKEGLRGGGRRTEG